MNGNYVYLCGSGVSVIDVSNPTAPALKSNSGSGFYCQTYNGGKNLATGVQGDVVSTTSPIPFHRCRSGTHRSPAMAF